MPRNTIGLVPTTNRHQGLLILVMRPGRQHIQDMIDIAREVAKAAPEILVHIAGPFSTAADVDAWKWSLPTLTISLGRLGKFMPRRGPILQNRAVKKLDQCRRFAAMGIPTPHTERFEFGRHYREEDFSRLSVLKPMPLDLTSSGRDLMLCETRQLHQIVAAEFPPDHFLRKAPVLVQRFIDTGPKPEYFRVLTLLGEPILWMRVKSAVEQIDLSGSDTAVMDRAIVDPRSTYGSVASDFEELLEFEVPSDVSEFAMQIYRGFPDIPLQANDIVREATTGKLFILEINAGGNTWDFSSRRVAESREKLGGRDKLVSIYNPWPRAAKALIRKVRELAN